ncbi:MAG: hypothetical protein HQL63_06130 [Magnetococcales bacterium]|nr:hypothetical protein [Magnetococcales bacterium]MBF0321337.1 hypothetical protein [Magnetococcales bacterium]
MNTYIRLAKDYLFVLICFIGVILSGALRPAHNWDMIPYVASAYISDGYSEEDLRSKTYDDVKNEVDSEKFTELTTGYLPATVYRDWRSLYEMSKSFSVRVMYIESIRLISKTGVSCSRASRISSIIFASSCVILISMILSQLEIPQFFIILVIYYAGIHHLAEISTADAMACFFSTLTLYCILSERNTLAFITISFLPLVRMDYIILSAFALLYMFFFVSKTASLISLIASTMAYFFAISHGANYGFLYYFNYTFIKIEPYPSKFVASKLVLDYVKPYMKCALDVFRHCNFSIYFFSAFILLGKAINQQINRLDYILIISIVFLLVRLTFLPLYEWRYYSFTMIVSSVYLIHVCLKGWQGMKRAPV